MDMHSSAAVGWRSPAFTAAQWAELEKQALIYKHFMAGIPVPPELLLPIRRSFFHFPALSYPSYYPKKLDPEPGRCRRTDGKKWRCSKDAHPDSKYCERHMHRSRKRSRKPVETQALSQSWSSSSRVASLSPTVSSGSQSSSRSFQSFPLNSASGGSIVQDSCNSQSCGPLLNIDSSSYGLNNKEYRYQHGGKAQLDDQNLFAEASGSTKGIGMEQDSPWSLLPSQLSPFSLSKASDSLMQSSYLQLQPAQDLRQATTINPLSIRSQQQQQYSFFESEFGTSATVRHESQLLRPLFDDWPKRDSWSGFGDDGSSQTSLSTTQLSISIPMPSTEFSQCSRSSNAPTPYKESHQ